MATTRPGNDRDTARLSIVTLLKDRVGSVVDTANWAGTQVGCVGWDARNRHAPANS